MTSNPRMGDWPKGHVTALDQSEFRSEDQHNYTTQLGG